MTPDADPPPEAKPIAVARKRVSELLHSQDALRAELQAARRNSNELERQLHSAAVSGESNRKTVHAALNLLEDAIHARNETLALNGQLQQRIAEREQAEQAFRQSQRDLEAAQKRLAQLSAEFDRRVEERTRELREGEERLNRLAAQQKRTEREERRRLARLLHDHVQQLLVAAKLRVDLLTSDAEADRTAGIDEALSTLNRAIQATRDLSVQLTPPLLHDQGLPAALDWLIARISKEQGLKIESQIDEDANPPTEDERDILFHAAQELLLNAAKHAGTKRVSLRLTRAPHEMRLEVRDRGAGFDPAHLFEGRGSFGLFQLQQRLESIAGSLNIETAPGRGTRISACLRAEPREERPNAAVATYAGLDRAENSASDSQAYRRAR